LFYLITNQKAKTKKMNPYTKTGKGDKIRQKNLLK